MSDSYLQLRGIIFRGLNSHSYLPFTSGVNVICGASDTGKSFLAESIDFMLGGSELRPIPELASYGEIELHLSADDTGHWQLRRATSGGHFSLADLKSPDQPETVLKQKHAHGKTDNLSGFLLTKIGLLGNRILQSRTKGTTRSLSFRDLARLVIVQEGEIHDRGSPFWSGQYVSKTADLATVKLLLTGVDDSAVVSAATEVPDNTRTLAFIDELLADLTSEIEDVGEDRGEILAQLERLDVSIAEHRRSLDVAQRHLDVTLEQRRQAFEARSVMQERLREIDELLVRFNLLWEHYTVDVDRLLAIRESGSLFVHVDVITCPLCGADPDAQHLDTQCDGNVDAIVSAAASEIQKIGRLTEELEDTVADLQAEADGLRVALAQKDAECRRFDAEIQEAVTPEVRSYQSSFGELIEKRSGVQRFIDLFARREKLEGRKLSLQGVTETSAGDEQVKVGIPDAVAHALSLKLSAILQEWNFPGECHVHFDKDTLDFVIDGKQRGSRGKGLRAITHAAVNIALLEYCQEKGLSHPGFVLLDSPLLAYFKPEGDDDHALKGTDLKERFYEYLVRHHGEHSQIIIIENPHPSPALGGRLTMTVFTGNPEEGRYGLL